MSKNLKIGVFIIVLGTILFLGNNTPIAKASNYDCREICSMTPEEIKGQNALPNNGGVYWCQAPLEKCTNDNGDTGCETSGDVNCCEKLDRIGYLKTYGDYNTEDLLTEIIDISNKLLGVVGSVALLFFIIAGIQMIFSGGSQEKVSSARTMMVQTVIGLVIFLSAYLIISFVQDKLIQKDETDPNFKIESKFVPK